MTASSLGQVGAITGSSGSTLVPPNVWGSGALPAGTFIRICVTYDNISATAPTVTCSTIGGATAIAGHATPIGSGATSTAGAGIWHQCFYAKTTAAIAGSTAICTVTTNQAYAKGSCVVVAASGVDATVRGTFGSGTSTSGAPSAATSGTALVAGDFVTGCISGENNAAPTADADTTNGSWSSVASSFTTGGSAATNVTAGIQTKVVNAAGVQTYNATTALDSVACVFAFQPMVPPTTTPATPTVTKPITEAYTVTAPGSFPSDATGYKVFEDAVLIGTISTPSGTLSQPGSAALGVTVTAKWSNGGGDSTVSSGANVTPDPSPPTTFTTTPGNASVSVAISRRSYASQYKVYRRLTSVGGAYTLVHTSADQVANGTYTYSDTGLTNGVGYDYVVSTYVQIPSVRESAQTSLQAATPSAVSMAYFDSPNWFDATAGSTPRTVVINFATGDDIYIIGLTGDSARTFGTPTATGLTFSLVDSNTGTASSCNVYIWKATAAAPGSSVTVTATSSGGPSGIAALVVTGSGGTGATAKGVSTSQSTFLVRGGTGSFVLFAAGDWSVTATTHAWTPAGYTERVANDNGSNYGAYIATWGDQGGAGSTAYGQSGSGAGTWTKDVVEILAPAAPPAALIPPPNVGLSTAAMQRSIR